MGMDSMVTETNRIGANYAHWADSGHTRTPCYHAAMSFQAPSSAPLPLFLNKLCPRAQLAERLTQLPRPLVMTNGVFDVVHKGHAVYLAQARALGASLLVALNTDASAKRLGKGPERPLNHQDDRAALLACMAAVDVVTWFDEDTPEVLIAQIRPDWLVKGGDYDMSALPETALVQSWGGKARALPFVSGYSTTALVQKIRQQR